MRAHITIGAELIAPLAKAADLAPVIRHHHERWDGQGYPDGLAGEQIPLEARIVSICDSWDAMVNDRPYRRALTVDSASAELAAGAGSLPAVGQPLTVGNLARAFVAQREIGMVDFDTGVVPGIERDFQHHVAPGDLGRQALLDDDLGQQRHAQIEVVGRGSAAVEPHIVTGRYARGQRPGEKQKQWKFKAHVVLAIAP
jgi:hypothetical protein